MKRKQRGQERRDDDEGWWSCEDMKRDVDGEDQTRMWDLRTRGGNNSSAAPSDDWGGPRDLLM